ncbi:DNA-binding transcriptional MerR regulator [Kribbella amoyensis]|uniref:DNA-binding transcriptional MerR regulator n=1 Tax=Kribbella amoyensis TaxID=996641 RepID=A0A561BWN4_9ACTN|nr:MerR family transcriptional regulator [Kribbella amoyensis]TWD83238.1 DNA-binding transcriptional MerR regulator [Kribbella amoyensis]
MRIGELSRRTGVSERSLRYYETQGLLSSDRSHGGHRQYTESAVDRVILIQQLLAAGLSSRKIGQLLPCMRDADGGPNQHATPALVTELKVERDRIDQMIIHLATSRTVLEDVIATASRELNITGPDQPVSLASTTSSRSHPHR